PFRGADLQERCAAERGEGFLRGRLRRWSPASVTSCHHNVTSENAPKCAFLLSVTKTTGSRGRRAPGENFDGKASPRNGTCYLHSRSGDSGDRQRFTLYVFVIVEFFAA